MENNNLISGLTFHHVAILVESIEVSKVHYAEVFGKENVSDVIIVDSQKVKICFVKISEGSYIELVEPIDEDSVVYKLLKKRHTYYHIAYNVKDIHGMVSRLEKLNYKALKFFNSATRKGKLCIFLYTPEAHLIELIEE